MTNVKPGDIAKITRGPNSGRMCLVLQPYVRRKDGPPCWLVEALQPMVRLNWSNNGREDPPGHHGSVPDAHLRRIPPLPEEELLSTAVPTKEPV